VFWVISVYFNIRNALPKSGTFLLGHPVYIYTYRVWWGNLRERDHLEDPGVDGRMIFRWILRKWDVGVWTGSSWLRRGTGGGHL